MIEPCILVIKDGIPDWCNSGCNRYHHGHHRQYALGEDEVSAGYRMRWRQLRLGELLAPDPVKYIPFTIVQVLENYAKTLKEHIAGGRHMVPLDIYDERRAICNGCELRDTQRDSCRICKCKLSPSELEALVIGDKLKWAVSECPVGKWKKWLPGASIIGKTTGKYGVVIGSYGMPGVVELNIAAIRKTCGDVPILISDDSTPYSMGRQRLMDMPSKWPGVSLIMSGDNLGHAPGDIRAYLNGLMWASLHGIKYLCKLSQRFIFTTNNWLAEVCDEMEREGHAACSQRAVHLHMQFAIRSECVFLDVARCLASEAFMKRIDPPGGKIATSAEDWLAAAISEGGLGPVHRCRKIPVDRFGKRAGVLWHNTHGRDVYGQDDGGEAYRELAKELGIDLGPEFSAAGWHVIAPNRPDANYHML